MGKHSRNKKKQPTTSGRKGKEKNQSEQKAMAEYIRLSREANGLHSKCEANEFHDKGNVRACFDKSMEAVMAAPDKWSPYRFTTFHWGLMALAAWEEAGKPSIYTNKDRRLLQREFVDNEGETIVFRVRALSFIFSFESKLRNDFSKEEKIEMSKLMLELVHRSPPEDENRIFDGVVNTITGNILTVKYMLEKHKTMAISHLHSYPMPRDISDAPPPSATFFGGNKCDCCAKRASELTNHLLKCARCEMMFYCSKTCQIKDWHGGHKKCCLKKGYIYEGEVMLLKDAVELGNDVTMPIHVRIVRPAVDPGLWFVTLAGFCNLSDEEQAKMGDPGEFVISGEQLIRIRQDLVPEKFKIGGQTQCLAKKPSAKHCIPEMENPPTFRMSRSSDSDSRFQFQARAAFR